MRSGYETLLAVFDAVTIRNLTTKREIADGTALSIVSVSKAASELIDAGLIMSDGSVSTGGRRSEAFSPAYSTRYAVIDLCEKPFSYAVVHPGEALSVSSGYAANVRQTQYLRDLDFSENVSLLANEIVERCGKGIHAAIALPARADLPDDYLGDDIASLLESKGIVTDLTASRAQALSHSRSVLTSEKPSLYVHIAQNASGIYFGDSMLELNFGGVSNGGLPFSEVLKCGLDAKALAAKTESLIRSASEVLSVRSVLLDSFTLPAETVDILLERIKTLEDVTFSAPVLEGLVRLWAIEHIKSIKSAHYKSK